MKNQAVKQLVEGAALAAVFAVLFLITIYVPLAWSLTLWASAYPVYTDGCSQWYEEWSCDVGLLRLFLGF